MKPNEKILVSACCYDEDIFIALARDKGDVFGCNVCNKICDTLLIPRPKELPHNPQGLGRKTRDKRGRFIKAPEVKLCEHCFYDLSIRNPSGFCDHLYFPENCTICQERIYPVKSPESDMENMEVLIVPKGMKWVLVSCYVALIVMCLWMAMKLWGVI